ncbi:MAG: hypothetical protein KAS70_01740 [Planctomycetes bacterium]|nr:hypothetical protein [Planctomycetota bacterium]
MLKNGKLLSNFEREQIRAEKLTYAEAWRLVNAMWQEARTLGVIPLKDPLEDIETDIRIARILNQNV